VIWGVVAVPTRRGVLALTALAGFAMPALTGIVDLALRARIPDAVRGVPTARASARARARSRRASCFPMGVVLVPEQALVREQSAALRDLASREAGLDRDRAPLRSRSPHERAAPRGVRGEREGDTARPRTCA